MNDTCTFIPFHGGSQPFGANKTNCSLLVTSVGENRRLFLPSGDETASEVRVISCWQPALSVWRADRCRGLCADGKAALNVSQLRRAQLSRLGPLRVGP